MHFRAFISRKKKPGTAVGYTVRQKNEKMNIAVSKNDFRKRVIENMNLAVVQFTVEWSGACQIISPIFHELAGSYRGQAAFFTVDVEKEPGIDEEYGVMELPTILFFKDGKVVDHIKGLIPRNTMIYKIENALANNLN